MTDAYSSGSASSDSHFLVQSRINDHHQTVAHRSRREVEGARCTCRCQAETDRWKSSHEPFRAEEYSARHNIITLEEQLAALRGQNNVLWSAPERHNSWSQIGADPQIEGSALSSDETTLLLSSPVEQKCPRFCCSQERNCELDMTNLGTPFSQTVPAATAKRSCQQLLAERRTVLLLSKEAGRVGSEF